MGLGQRIGRKVRNECVRETTEIEGVKHGLG